MTFFGSEEDFWDDYHDRTSGPATMDGAHREWHRNAGVPMGTPGCPQDACHDDHDDDHDEWASEPGDPVPAPPIAAAPLGPDPEPPF